MIDLPMVSTVIRIVAAAHRRGYGIRTAKLCRDRSFLESAIQLVRGPSLKMCSEDVSPLGSKDDEHQTFFRWGRDHSARGSGLCDAYRLLPKHWRKDPPPPSVGSGILK